MSEHQRTYTIQPVKICYFHAYYNIQFFFRVSISAMVRGRFSFHFCLFLHYVCLCVLFRQQLFSFTFIKFENPYNTFRALYFHGIVYSTFHILFLFYSPRKDTKICENFPIFRSFGTFKTTENNIMKHIFQLPTVG